MTEILYALIGAITGSGGVAGIVRQLENDVARNGRIVALLRPFLCGSLNCHERTKVDLGGSETNASNAEAADAVVSRHRK